MRDFAPRRVTELYGITAEKIATFCGVHVTTARRWKRGEQPPATALKVVKLMSTGDLGVITEKWAGWCLVNDQLVAPDQSTYTQAEILAGPFWRRLAQTYQQEQKLPRQGDWIAEKWISNEIRDAHA